MPDLSFFLISNVKSCKAVLAALFACRAREVDSRHSVFRKLRVALVVYGVAGRVEGRQCQSYPSSSSPVCVL